MKNLLLSFFGDKPLAAVLSVSVVIFASHILYVFVSYQYPKWDEHLFLEYAIQTRELLLNPNNFVERFLAIYSARPPLYSTLVSLNSFIFGIRNVYEIALILNGVFYVGTILGIYFLAKEFLTRSSSAIGSIIFAFYGFPLFYLHFAYSETGTTFFVVWSLFYLSKTNFFSRPKEVFWFSIFFLLGLLTRWVTPIFVIGPMVFVISVALWRQLKNKTRYAESFFKSTALFLVVGLLLPLLFYYLPNFSSLSPYFLETQSKSVSWVQTLNYLPSGLENTFSIRSVMFYFNILSQQTVFFFGLFVVGFIISLVHFRKYSFLLLGFLFSYAFFTFGSILKDDRYIVPTYPYMAIISAVIFDYVRQIYVRNVAIVAVIVLGFFNFLGASWGEGPMGKQGLKDIVLPEFIHHPRRIYLTPIVWPPRPNEINVQSFVDKALENSDGVSPYIVNTYSFDPLEFDNALHSIGYYTQRGEVQVGTLRGIPDNDFEEVVSRISKANFIIVSDKLPVPVQKTTPDKMVRIFNDALSERGGELPSAFVKIGAYDYPLDKVQLAIYKRTRELRDLEVHELRIDLGKAAKQLDSK